jgi:hypothetical protein
VDRIFAFDQSGFSFVRSQLAKHFKYFVVLAIQRSFRRWVAAIELLSNLTFEMFVLTQLYNAHFRDDGTCQPLQSSNACLEHKTLLDSNISKCQWVQDRLCIWRAPIFTPLTLAVISCTALLVASICHLLTHLIFWHIILAPTERELAEDAKILSKHQSRIVEEVRGNGRGNAVEEWVKDAEKDMGKLQASRRDHMLEHLRIQRLVSCFSQGLDIASYIAHFHNDEHDAILYVYLCIYMYMYFMLRQIAYLGRGFFRRLSADSPCCGTRYRSASFG